MNYAFRSALGVAILLLVTACGSDPSSGTPGGGSPTLAGVRFDLSDAVGLQIGRSARADVQSSQSSGLVKLTAYGTLEDAIAAGQVTVLDFLNRDGRVFALLSGSSCGFVEILTDGSVSCVDSEILSLRLRSMQFDATGTVYYRGELDGGRSVIRSSLGGETRDFYVAQDSIDVAYFLVTRDGTLLVRGETAGEFGYQQWLRAIDASGRVTNLPIADLVAFAPDGSLWGFTDSLSRLLFVDGIRLDPRPYCSDQASARFQRGALDFDCAEITNAVAFDAFDRLIRLDGQVLAITGEGLLRYFPAVERIPVAVDTVLTGTASGNYALLAGYSDALEPRAFLVDLTTEESVDVLSSSRIEVFRARIDHDANRVVLYGLDLDRNQPVLANYDIDTKVLSVNDMIEPLAASFAVLDLGTSHVQAAPDLTPHELNIVIEVVDAGAGEVVFDLRSSPDIPWFDRFEWDLGDGTIVDGDFSSASITHVYSDSGVFSVSVTGTNYHGATTEAAGSVAISLGTTP